MIHLFGASGFIGKAIAIAAKNRDDLLYYSSSGNEDLLFDLRTDETWTNVKIKPGDKVIFLCWPGLPNYAKSFHLTQNLCQSIRFFEYALSQGAKKIICAGTCYEYGLQNGMLSEDRHTEPITSYAVAKDSLRRALSAMCAEATIDFAWLRIFYPYGDDQNPRSLVPSINRAINNGDPSFDMSQGDQIRDFIPVEEVAKLFLAVTDKDTASGIINIGSGVPISIRDFVDNYILSKSANLHLNLGIYPRRTDEPLAFWADRSKLNQILTYNGCSSV